MDVPRACTVDFRPFCRLYSHLTFFIFFLCSTNADFEICLIVRCITLPDSSSITALAWYPAIVRNCTFSLLFTKTCMFIYSMAFSPEQGVETGGSLSSRFHALPRSLSRLLYAADLPSTSYGKPQQPKALPSPSPKKSNYGKRIK